MEPVYAWLRDSLGLLAADGWLPLAFSYGFVVNALLCALFIGPLLGLLGTLVVARRMAFFSQAIGNAALTGVAIGVLIGESFTAPYVSMFSFCLFFALLLTYTRSRTQLPQDTLIGVFLSISLALGASLLLFVSARVNTHILDSVLFGSILTVNGTDIDVLLGVGLLALLAGLPFYNRLLLAGLNRPLAQVRGPDTLALDYLFIVLLTLVTVACVKIVGAVLVEALLLIPAAAARNLSRNLRGFVLGTVAIATLSCLGGILLPLQFDLPLPSGGAIVLLAAACFGVTTLLRALLPAYREASL